MVWLYIFQVLVKHQFSVRFPKANAWRTARAAPSRSGVRLGDTHDGDSFLRQCRVVMMGRYNVTQVCQWASLPPRGMKVKGTSLDGRTYFLFFFVRRLYWVFWPEGWSLLFPAFSWCLGD